MKTKGLGKNQWKLINELSLHSDRYILYCRLHDENKSTYELEDEYGNTYKSFTESFITGLINRNVLICFEEWSPSIQVDIAKFRLNKDV